MGHQGLQGQVIYSAIWSRRMVKERKFTSTISFIWRPKTSPRRRPNFIWILIVPTFPGLGHGVPKKRRVALSLFWTLHYFVTIFFLVKTSLKPLQLKTVKKQTIKNCDIDILVVCFNLCRPSLMSCTKDKIHQMWSCWNGLRSVPVGKK